MEQPPSEQQVKPTAASAVPAPRENLAYTEITDPAYESLSAKEFTVRETRDGSALLSGPCPRCRDAMEVLVPAEVFFSSRTGFLARVLKRTEQPVSASSGEDLQRVPLMCRCTGGHSGRPSDRRGCGAYWNLVIEDQK